MKFYYKLSLIIICIIIGLFILIFGIPVLISALYSKGEERAIFITHFSAENVFSYYGTVLSFLGTVVLGTVALLQNRSISNINDKLMRLQAQQYVPNFKIEIIKNANSEILKNEIPDKNITFSNIRYGPATTSDELNSYKDINVYLQNGEKEKILKKALVFEIILINDISINELILSGIELETVNEKDKIIKNRHIKLDIPNSAMLTKENRIRYEINIFYDYDLYNELLQTRPCYLAITFELYTLMNIKFVLTVGGKINRYGLCPNYYYIDKYDITYL